MIDSSSIRRYTTQLHQLDLTPEWDLKKKHKNISIVYVQQEFNGPF